MMEPRGEDERLAEAREIGVWARRNNTGGGTARLRKLKAES
jgi:hypothetical protein